MKLIKTILILFTINIASFSQNHESSWVKGDFLDAKSMDRSPLKALTLNRDGSLYIVGQRNNIRILNINKPSEMSILRGHSFPVIKSIFKNDSILVSFATNKISSEIILWDLNSFEKIIKHKIPNGVITDATYRDLENDFFLMIQPKNLQNSYAGFDVKSRIRKSFFQIKLNKKEIKNTTWNFQFLGKKSYLFKNQNFLITINHFTSKEKIAIWNLKSKKLEMSYLDSSTIGKLTMNKSKTSAYFLSETFVLYEFKIINDKIEIIKTNLNNIFSNKKIKDIYINENLDLLLVVPETGYLFQYNTITQKKTEISIKSDLFEEYKYIDEKHIAFIDKIGRILIWEVDSNLILSIYPIPNKKDYVIIDNNQNFLATRDSSNFIEVNSSDKKNSMILSQYENFYNKPNLVYGKIPSIDVNVKKQIELAYNINSHKKSKRNYLLDSKQKFKVDFTENKETVLVNINKNGKIKILVNNNPIFGSKGFLYYKGEDIVIPLAEGKNIISLTIEDLNGFITKPITKIINCKKKLKNKRLYFVGIAVNLDNWKVEEEIKSVSQLFKSQKKYYDDIEIIEILGEKVNKESFKELKKRFLKINPDDIVIMYVAGHGEKVNGDYSLASAGEDSLNTKKILYSDLLNILDVIPSRNRLVLINSCYSGENLSSSELLKFNNEDSETILKILFGNIFQGIGATVIASSLSNQMTYFDTKGVSVFTNGILRALSKNKSDLNGDSKISVSELTNFIEKDINNYIFKLNTKLKNRKVNQNISVRELNTQSNFILWNYHNESINYLKLLKNRN